jgi:UrcA family protein
MNMRDVARSIGPIVLLAGLCVGSAALGADQLKTVTVAAGVVTKTVGQSAIGAPLEQVTLTRHVSYSDLDLTTYAGVVELKKRVADTARAACEQLDELYPLEEKNAPACIRQAVADASHQVDEAIAAAEREAKAE